MTETTGGGQRGSPGSAAGVPPPVGQPAAEETLDLESESVEPTLFVPPTEPYDPAPEREKIRGWIALILICLLVAIVVAAFISLWSQWASLKDLKGVLEVVLGPIIGLVGAVTGFYFGEKSRS